MNPKDEGLRGRAGGRLRAWPDALPVVLPDVLPDVLEERGLRFASA
jgi:hypothetical protein